MRPNYGASIQHWLTTLGVSQIDLARRTKRSRTTISKVITGDRRPSTELLEDIAKALALSVPVLIAPPPEVSTSPVSE